MTIPAAPPASSRAVRAVMQANRKTGTKPEVQLRSALHAQGMRFRKNLLVRVANCSVRPDVVFTRRRVAVFVDGCFWHRCPAHGNLPRVNSAYWQAKLQRNVRRDATVAAALRQAGWRVVRVWEHEDVSDALAQVLSVVAPVQTTEN